MDAIELRGRLEALRAASAESAALMSAQLDILEAAVEQLMTAHPALPTPHVIPIEPAVEKATTSSARWMTDEAFYLEFEL
jgi:hypothetical protein